MISFSRNQLWCAAVLILGFLTFHTIAFSDFMEGKRTDWGTPDKVYNVLGVSDGEVWFYSQYPTANSGAQQLLADFSLAGISYRHIRFLDATAIEVYALRVSLHWIAGFTDLILLLMALAVLRVLSHRRLYGQPGQD